MAKFELKLPKMGESVAEATLTAWLKDVGERIEADEAVLEIATDKVDSEVPSEVEGVLIEKLFEVDAIIEVGQTIAIIETESDVSDSFSQTPEVTLKAEPEAAVQLETSIEKVKETIAASSPISSNGSRFYSPLVKNIAKKEGISQSELDAIQGSGKEGRVTKNDVLSYLSNKSQTNPVGSEAPLTPANPLSPGASISPSSATVNPVISQGEDEIIEMSRMGKLVSKHMTDSIQTSAHVQSFIEVDVTKIWNWRLGIKEAFKAREGQNITFTPIFLEAVAHALTVHPMLNISVQDGKIIKRKNINIGMAAALEDGNLIVPVIKNADQLNLIGMTKRVNDLAHRARTNNLKPDDIQDGTYTVTNVGGFGSIMGTPIINQPQVGILALGAIRKVPAVIETNEGDFIGIRQRMFLSHSYDHRVVNGALGGQFLKTVKEYLEAWDENRTL
ncbi:MAG: dihydrolipoamide acetyltransferase family protein [Flavobacteriaceae bacterium]|jgi:2-oxoglutarate dehydrogenase E2 component (dihydrolipoamide succinyltransferase)|nr:2-oxo acid dehydrogenase subunit E2 [Flavobacteriaceae bacterium]MDB2493662.1 2-oxo acid dehydrogenase subunit E2 [Flavobacteriaceae bacterium]MDG1284718.1 dihydrolipoamide acetyltransferase family protein [Flavobacteriaceae bacterium]